MGVSNSIRYYRQRAKITQKVLAVQLGVGRTEIWLWESGRGLPSAEQLEKVAQILGIGISSLYPENAVLDVIAQSSP